jgi:hypothetical protein
LAASPLLNGRTGFLIVGFLNETMVGEAGDFASMERKL